MTKSTSAGGVVVNNKTGKICVVSQAGLSWSLPKGHIESGETEEAAAIREIYEESGIKQENLKLLKKLGTYHRYRMGRDNNVDHKKDLKTIHIYLFTTDQEKLIPPEDNHPEAIWVEPDKVAEVLTFDKDKEFFKSIINKVRKLSKLAKPAR